MSEMVNVTGYCLKRRTLYKIFIKLHVMTIVTVVPTKTLQLACETHAFGVKLDEVTYFLIRSLI